MPSTMSVYDSASRDLRNALPVLPEKVLLWNINGFTGKGMAAIRNVLVPNVIREIKPSVMLLQEPATWKLVSLIQSCFRECVCPETWRNLNLPCFCKKNWREFISVQAGVWGESQILYDANIYMDISQDKIFPTANLDTSISADEALQMSINRVTSLEMIRDLFIDRLSCVCLKEKWDASVPGRAVMYIHIVSQCVQEKR